MRLSFYRAERQAAYDVLLREQHDRNDRQRDCDAARGANDRIARVIRADTGNSYR